MSYSSVVYCWQTKASWRRKWTALKNLPTVVQSLRMKMDKVIH